MSELFKRTHLCGNLNIKNVEEEVVLNGWVAKQRSLGGLIFVDLRDKTGIVQITFDDTIPKEVFDQAEALRSEYVIGIKGIVKERAAKNPNLPTGEIEVFAKELVLYSESETPPIYIKDDDNVDDNLRLKYRYLDLRKLKMQENVRFRHQVTKLARDYFDENGFTEIETPILIKSTPEGARDYLVPSRVNQGHFYALPQSPQLFKQLLMVSGCDRYMQIAKCFRDEDLRADRQPEFTQIDLEMSFVDQDDVIEMQEGFLQRLFKELMDIEIKTPFPRMTYDEAMERFGSDKPDTRFGFELRGKVRELKNTIESAFNMEDSDFITLDSVQDLLQKIEEDGATARNVQEIVQADSVESKDLIFSPEAIKEMLSTNGVNLKQMMENYESFILTEALKQDRKLAKVAARLSISPQKLQYRMEKLNLK